VLSHECKLITIIRVWCCVGPRATQARWQGKKYKELCQESNPVVLYVAGHLVCTATTTSLTYFKTCFLSPFVPAKKFSAHVTNWTAIVTADELHTITTYSAVPYIFHYILKPFPEHLRNYVFVNLYNVYYVLSVDSLCFSINTCHTHFIFCTINKFYIEVFMTNTIIP
jgi:hypothetical protein